MKFLEADCKTILKRELHSVDAAKIADMARRRGADLTVLAGVIWRMQLAWEGRSVAQPHSRPACQAQVRTAASPTWSVGKKLRRSRAGLGAVLLEVRLKHPVTAQGRSRAS